MKVSIALISLLALPLGAEALPAFNPKCAKSINLRAPPGGAGVYFDQDCQMGYVLPPTTGSVRVEQIARTSGLDQCPILQNYTKIFEARSQELADLVKRADRRTGANPGGGSPLFPNPGPNPGGNQPNPEFDRIMEEMEELMDKQVKAVEKLKVFWNMPAASMQLSYQVNHQKLVDEYKRLNPGYNFRAITLHGSKIHISRFVGKTETATQFPAVLHADIPGSRGPMQNGEVGDDSGVESGDAQSGQVMLSVFGARPMYNAATRTMPTKLNARELAAYMVANINYVYELQVQRKYELKYNLGAFIRRVQSSESEGGFFSTKTINKLIVEERSTDWFEIKVQAEDGRWDYDNEFAQVMKAQAIDRAIKNIAMLVQGTPIEAPGLTKPNANGADVSARELRKCPYVYCQVGAAVLDVANAIFGNAQSVAEYIRPHDTFVRETSEERKPLQFRGTVDFKADLLPGVI